MKGHLVSKENTYHVTDDEGNEYKVKDSVSSEGNHMRIYDKYGHILDAVEDDVLWYTIANYIGENSANLHSDF